MSSYRYPHILSAVVAVALCLTLSHVARATPRATSARAANQAATFDLRDFGAVGDGATDDGPALQQALDALADAGGGTLLVPAGHYVIATPVAEDFGGLASVTIQGVESSTPVPPPTAEYLTLGLDLTSEFLPRTGEQQVAVTLSGLRSLLVRDVAFVGTPEAATDALITLAISYTADATVRHCEFYGLYSAEAAIVQAYRSRLSIEQTEFLGCSANSGVYGPVVQNIEWTGISVSDTLFVDYGWRAFYGKTGYGSPLSWVNVGNAAPPTNDSPRREVVLRNVFFDEGGWMAVTSMPDRYQPPSAPIDLFYATGLFVNVSSFGTAGSYLSGLRRVMVENSQYGWSHNADSAINLAGVGYAILDRVTTSDSATRIRADYQTARLTVIDSSYTDLASFAQVTKVVSTAEAGSESTSDTVGDPVQYVRAQFEGVLGREPDAAAHFYWSDQILACDDAAGCVADRRAALGAYLAASPSPDFALTGVVTDETGAPVAGVAVALTGSQSVATETGADGSYHFDRLPTSGVYTVSVAKRHYTFAAPSQTFTTPNADRRADFRATLNRHNISGKLTDDRGVAIAGVAVKLSGGQSATATTDAAGNYTFASLPAGASYTVTPSSARHTFAPASQTFGDLGADQSASFTGVRLFLPVSGRVTDGAGRALQGVAVSLSGTRSAAATTDAAGSFVFADLPRGGTYTVTPSLRFYASAPASQTFSNLSADGQADFRMTLLLRTVGGRVTENGAGLAGVTVTLSGAKSATATTDSGGNYSFPNLPADGTYTVTPSKAHYTFAPAGQTFNGLDADARADFAATLLRHKISGRAARPDGSALAGATATLSGTQSATATTDSSGNFSFANLPGGGTYTVTLSLANYTFAPASQSFGDLGADQSAAFTGTLNRYTISGQVTGSGGKPLAGATLALAGAQSATATTDAAGNYSFPNLPAGADYIVTASKANYTFAPPSRALNNLTANQTANFTGSLVNYRISGRATENGSALSGVTVALSGSQTATATTDAGGNYSFSVTAEGSYTVTPSKTNYTFTPPGQVLNNLASDQTANFAATLNRYTISGRVSDANGRGVPGVSVALSGTQSAAATTDAAGNFSFAGLAGGGSYTVTPALANYAFAPPSQTFDALPSDKTAAFSAAPVMYKISGRVAQKGTGLPGVTVTLDGTHPLLGQQRAQAVTGADGSYSFTATAGGDYTVTPSLKNYSFDRASASFAKLGGDQSADFAATLQTVFEFSAASYAAGEGAGGFDVTVTRGGDTSSAATVNYSAQDGTAQQGKDLGPVVGRLAFAPGETTKSFKVFVADDSFVEGDESLTLKLSPAGVAVVGAQSSATLTIKDNDSDPAAANPVDDARFFVRQHYWDFFNREPDDAGLAFWTNNITGCGADAQCRQVKRVDTSAAFFLSIEFQQTGYLVHRAYVASYGRAPRRVEEFLFDSRIVGDGVVVGQAGWEQRLEANKQAFFAEFVARDRFAAQYPATLSPAQFVAALGANAGGALSSDDVSAAVAEFGAAADSADAGARARALRRVAESRAFSQREFDRAFVLMQYFGYLQRNPDDPPDHDLEGLKFWLAKLDSFGGDYRKAEMVRAFIESAEYRGRFGK